MVQKCKVLETCLSIKDEYLSMPPAPQHDQEPFWAKILKEKLSPDLVSKFKDWKNLKESVENWCYLRRTLLREGNLPPVSQGQPELDTLVDSWNTVFVTRFCQVHRGYFENGVWAMTENRVSWMVSEHIDRSISSMLQKRRDELESPVRPRLLNNSSLTEYDNAVGSVQDGFTASKRDHAQTMESEAVLSMVMELRPVLEHAIPQHLNGARQTLQQRSGGPNTESNISTELAAMRGGPRSNNNQRLTIPSNGSSASASPISQQPIPRAAATPLARNTQRSLPESSESELGRKRKSLEPNDQSKRPRLDSGSFSNVPPRAEAPLRGREPAKGPPQRQLSPSRYEDTRSEANVLY
jgi:hypothetical protein